MLQALLYVAHVPGELVLLVCSEYRGVMFVPQRTHSYAPRLKLLRPSNALQGLDLT